MLNGDGELISLQGELLVEVQAVDKEPPPRGLYLRSGMFQKPSLDSWLVGPLSAQRFNTSERPLRLQRPLARQPVRKLELVRTPEALDRVFTPEGLCSVYGLTDLRADRKRQWFRAPNQAASIYEISYQQRPVPQSSPIDPQWQTDILMEVPDEARSHFQELLDQWKPAGSPLQKAQLITAGLQLRCTYARQEPSGPFDHALINFLHGDRIGFCMHFASATAIMLRMVGVPCRIGVGLYGGAFQSDSKPVLFGSQHAHAWVELPLEGHGWVIFDPTPPAERGVNPSQAFAASNDAETEVPVEQASASWTEQASAWLDRLLGSPWPWIGVLALLLLPLRRRKASASGPTVQRTARPARRWLLQILRQLNHGGRPRSPGTTIEQHALALENSGCLHADLQDAFQAYQEVRFGGRDWGPSLEERMRRGLAAATSIEPISPSASGADSANN